MASHYKHLSPSCQEVIFEDFSDLSTAKVVIRTCMRDPDLAPVITNHRCNGVTLTPSGLYCDMAMTVASYVWHRCKVDDDAAAAELPGINVCDMEVHKPLIVKSFGTMQDSWLEMTVRLSFAPGTSHSDLAAAELSCTFASITPAGVKLQDCGQCRVRYEDPSTWHAAWTTLTPAVAACIDRLDVAALKASDGGGARLVQRDTAYAMFESFVHYTGPYRNMARVTFAPATLEATAVLDFVPPPGVASFTGPYHLDGSCHVSGFLCNAVERDGARNAFISNGVGAVRMSSRFDPARQAGGGSSSIRNYVRMVTDAKDKSVLRGTVYVLQDGEIVGVWESVRFKRIPRRVLNIFLPPPLPAKEKQ